MAVYWWQHLAQRTRRTELAKKLVKHMTPKEHHHNGAGSAEVPSDSVVSITSRFSVEQLPTGRLCELCEHPMRPSTTTWRCRGTLLTVISEQVPALRCADAGGCGTAFVPTEVIIDLCMRAIPLLRRARDFQMVKALERDISDHRQGQPSIATQPKPQPA